MRLGALGAVAAEPLRGSVGAYGSSVGGWRGAVGVGVGRRG